MSDRCLDPTCTEHWPDPVSAYHGELMRLEAEALALVGPRLEAAIAELCGHDCQVGVDDAPLSDPAKAWQCTVCGTVLG